MDNDKKLDFVYQEIVTFKANYANLLLTQNKHNDVIFGNGKEGLVVRQSLAEDDIKGLNISYQNLKTIITEAIKSLTKSITDLTGKLNFHLGKMVGVSATISFIFLVIGLALTWGDK